MGEVRGHVRSWRSVNRMLHLDGPLIMGIVNVTPDSFSDGGLYANRDAAIAHGIALASAGADIIDVGGESTRPGAPPVAPAEEIARVCPVIEALARELDIPLSVDTRHASVAAAALDAGASIINDVSGFRDPEMVALAAASDAGLVVMHMLGEPSTMQVEPAYKDVVAEVCAYLAAQAAALEQAGVARERIALDPGIGFGKTTGHNVQLLARLDALVELGYPVLLGASRKRFIGEITGETEPARRVCGSVSVALWAAAHGAHVVRVHDVKETADAFALWGAMAGARL